MKIMRVQAPAVKPPPEYVLTLSYEDLHELYHMMLDLSRRYTLAGVESDFFEALRNHA